MPHDLSSQSISWSACFTVSLSELQWWWFSKADQIRASPCRQAEKHSCHCNHSNSVNLVSPTTAWPRGHPLQSRLGGWLGGSGFVLRGSVLCFRRCRSGSSWCPDRIRYSGEATLTEKDGGHQTPTQSSLPPPPLSLRVNNSIKSVPEIAVMPPIMPSPGPSNHLILRKHPAHTGEQISWRCLAASSV